MRYFAVSIALLALAGCSDPKAASEKNFRVAIQSYLDTAYPRCYIAQNFPTFKDDWNIHRTNEQLDALVKAGMLNEKEIQQEQKDMFGQGSHMVTKVSYDLTTDGKKYYKPNITKNFKGEAVGAFCGGKASVRSIGQYTEPAEMMGLKVSRVNYEYTVTDLPSWASSPEIQEAVDGIKADLNSQTTPRKTTDALVLTNNGWVHEKLLSR